MSNFLASRSGTKLLNSGRGGQPVTHQGVNALKAIGSRRFNLRAVVRALQGSARLLSLARLQVCDDELVDRSRSCVPRIGRLAYAGLRTRQDRRSRPARRNLERAMAVAVVPREDNAFANDNPPPARNAVLARYRQLREISKRHHHDILKLISGDAMLQQARRLGLAQGRTLILDDMEEMSYVFDLAIYTAPPRRSRAIDRYARSAQLPPGSDEALMLEAMRAARFAILILGRRHDAAGVIATDLFRRTDVWLVDIGLEASLEEGAMMATRLYTPEQFSMTAGVNVPFDLALIEDLYDALPRRLGETRLTDLIDDRRFAETIYRVALADGIMDRVTYQDPPEDAS
jgi:hypothetical protein